VKDLLWLIFIAPFKILWTVLTECGSNEPEAQQDWRVENGNVAKYARQAKIIHPWPQPPETPEVLP
jgi:hypothetical protein